MGLLCCSEILHCHFWRLQNKYSKTQSWNFHIHTATSPLTGCGLKLLKTVFPRQLWSLRCHDITLLYDLPATNIWQKKHNLRVKLGAGTLPELCTPWAKVREMTEECTSCYFHTAVVLWRKCTVCVSASSLRCSPYTDAVKKQALIGRTNSPLIRFTEFLSGRLFGATEQPLTSLFSLKAH